MEDFRSLVWLAIAVIWILTRLARRGVKRARREKKPGARQLPSRSATQPGGARPGQLRQPVRPDQPSQTEILGRGGTGPPPIVPR